MPFEARTGFKAPTSILFLILPLFVVLAIVIQVDTVKPLWFDEQIVSKVALQPHLSDIWKILTSGQSPHPPLNFLVVRFLYSLFGVSELTTRLPSTFGFAAMEICLFFFVAKRSNPAFGTVAMLFPLVTLARGYAFEAKPYGVLLGCAGVSLICWRNSRDGRFRRLWIAGLAISLSWAALSHFFGTLLVLPVLVGEVVRTLKRGRLDWFLLGSLLASYAPLAWLLPILRAGGQIHGVHPWQPQLTVPFIFSSADQLLLGATVPLLLCLFIAAASRLLVPVEERNAAIPTEELAAATALALLPLAAFLGARLAGIKVMDVKYVLPMLAGAAIVFAWSLYAVAARRTVVGVLLSLIVGVWAWRDLVVDLHAAQSERKLATGFAPPAEVKAVGRLPIVIQMNLYFILTRYAKPEVAERMYFLLDPEASLKYLQSDAQPRSMLLNPDFFGVNVDQIGEFETAHHQFFIYESLSRDGSWLVQKIKDDGARVELLKGVRDERWYLVTTNTN